MFQYLRDNFYGAGQDSFTRPFAENQELFELMQNVMPVAQGTIRLRHGYQLFNNPGPTINRMYGYQNLQPPGARLLVYMQGSAIQTSFEDGSVLATIFTSTGTSSPRAVNSRDYIFFPQVTAPFTWPSGQQSDGKKWNAFNSPTISDWGLARPSSAVNVTSTASAGNITLVSVAGRAYGSAWRNTGTGHYSDLNVGVGSFASGTAGPALPTSDSQTSTGNVAWSNITNVNAIDGVTATVTLSTSGTQSEQLNAEGFGFSIPSTGTIYGIQVTINKKQSASAGVAHNSTTDLVVQLLKAGTNTGNNKADGVTPWPSSLTSVSYGGAADLWGATWTPADINNAAFGVGVSAIVPLIGPPPPPVNTTLGIDYIQITVTYATGAGANTGAITGKQVSISLPTNNPPGADTLAILATLDGGDTSTFYLLDTVPAGTATYIDNTPDNVLVTKNRATELDLTGTQHGLVNNSFPPLQLQFPTNHRGRIYGAILNNIYFSKSLDEITSSTGLVLGRPEEAWPALYFIPVSTSKETIRGLLSDGNTLYVGTERKLWRLDGDGPLNFSKPEIIFNEVGVLNQDVWQVCFAEGQPIGMIWLTPDNRVIMSNFASYQDIGTPVQNVLSSINPSPTNPPWAAFFSRQEFDIYVLAIPTGANTSPDTLLVYDLRAGRWVVWVPTDQLTSALFNINASGIPQWIVAAASGKTYQFLPSLTQDRVNDTPVSINPVVKTPWMHLGQPTMFKALNEVEVQTGDTGQLITVEGASTLAQTSSPNTVISGAPLILSPRGTWKTYLARYISKDKYYRLTFTGTGSQQDFLQGFVIEAVPFPY